MLHGAADTGEVFLQVGVVETEELGALGLEAGDAAFAHLDRGPNLLQRHPHRNDDGGDRGGADRPARRASTGARFLSPMIST